MRQLLRFMRSAMLPKLRSSGRRRILRGVIVGLVLAVAGVGWPPAPLEAPSAHAQVFGQNWPRGGTATLSVVSPVPEGGWWVAGETIEFLVKLSRTAALGEHAQLELRIRLGEIRHTKRTEPGTGSHLNCPDSEVYTTDYTVYHTITNSDIAVGPFSTSSHPMVLQGSNRVSRVQDARKYLRLDTRPERENCLPHAASISVIQGANVYFQVESGTFGEGHRIVGGKAVNDVRANATDDSITLFFTGRTTTDLLLELVESNSDGSFGSSVATATVPATRDAKLKHTFTGLTAGRRYVSTIRLHESLGVDHESTVHIRRTARLRQARNNYMVVTDVQRDSSDAIIVHVNPSEEIRIGLFNAADPATPLNTFRLTEGRDPTDPFCDTGVSNCNVPIGAVDGDTLLIKFRRESSTAFDNAGDINITFAFGTGQWSAVMVDDNETNRAPIVENREFPDVEAGRPLRTDLTNFISDLDFTRGDFARITEIEDGFLGRTRVEGIATVIYEPYPGDGGVESLQYTATDTHGATAQGTLRFIVAQGPIPQLMNLAVTSTPQVDNTYAAGETIQVRATFDLPVTVTGTPHINMRLDAGPTKFFVRPLNYTSGSGTAELLFEYTVQPFDDDPTGILIPAGSILAFLTNRITGAGGHDATVTFDADVTSAHLVRGGELYATTAQITSDAGPDQSYAPGDIVSIVVTFSKLAQVVGQPSIQLNIGDRTVAATAEPLPEPNFTLTFNYEVAADDMDRNGITVQNLLVMPDADNRITDQFDRAAETLGRFPPITNAADHLVAATAVPSPRLLGLEFANLPPAPQSAFKVGDPITVRATFNTAVTVDSLAAVAIELDSGTVLAPYASGTGTTAVDFTYTVAAGDQDADGIQLPQNPIRNNSGLPAPLTPVLLVRDADGTAAHLAHPAVAADSTRIVNGHRPAVTALRILDSTEQLFGAQLFNLGSTLQAEVTFSAPVDVTGTPQLALALGGTTVQTTEVSGSGTNTLTFAYTVAAGDVASRVDFPASGITLPTGVAIAATDGTAAFLEYPAVTGPETTHIVRATQPIPYRAWFSSDPGDDGSYEIPGEIELTVQFSEPVQVAGSPGIAVALVSAVDPVTETQGFVNAATTTGYSATVTFTRQLQAGEEACHGLALRDAAFQAFSQTNRIFSLHGNLADVTQLPQVTAPHHRVACPRTPTTENVLVSIEPYFAPQTYTIRSTIQLVAEYTLPFTEDNEPPSSIIITIGEQNRTATRTSTGAPRFPRYEYEVIEGDEDTDGISVISETLSNPSFANHLVDGVSPTITGLDMYLEGSPTASFPRTYVQGSVIVIDVTTNEQIEVTGAVPHLELTFDDDVTAIAEWHDATAERMQFRYTVQEGDFAGDGIGIAANALKTPEGTTLADVAGNPLTRLTVPAVTADPTKHRLSTIAAQPTALTITSNPGPDQSYGTGDAITLDLTFDQPVIVIFDRGQDPVAAPQLALQIGTDVVHATVASPATGNLPATTTVEFSYTITSTDGTDADGVSVAASALTFPNDASIVTARFTENVANREGFAAITNDRRHRVNDAIAQISGVTISTPAPESTGFFVADDTITATVQFTDTVTATTTESITLALVLDAGTVTAGYASQPGDDQLQFTYTVQAGDFDPDGVAVPQNAVRLADGATLKHADTTTDAILTLARPVVEPAARVDAVAPTILTVSFDPGHEHGTASYYGFSDTVTARIAFSEVIAFTGSAAITMILDGQPVVVPLRRGHDTSEWLFDHQVRVNDAWSGLGLQENSLTVTGGTPTDPVGNELASLNFAAITPDATRHHVDGVPPRITDVQLLAGPQQSGTTVYRAGDAIEVQLTFDETVVVTDTPSATLLLGGTAVPATYAAGTGTTTLRFAHTVTAGEEYTGVGVQPDGLDFDRGTVTDLANNLPDPALRGIAANPRTQIIDAAPPALLALTITSDPGPNRTYGPDDTIEITATFDEPVELVGTPTLTLGVGDQTHTVAATARTEAAPTVVFAYTVLAADEDTDGVSVAADALQLSATDTVRDPYGNAVDAASLTFTPIMNSAAHLVAASPGPNDGLTGFEWFSEPRNGTSFLAGENIVVAANFNVTVDVTTPEVISVTIAVESGDVSAAYVSGSGTTQLRFRHVVQEADRDADGISLPAGALTIGTNGSVLHSGAAVILTSLAVPADASRRIGPVTVAPTPATPDLNGDGRLNELDAQILHHALSLEQLLGDGTETSGFDYFRHTFLSGLVPVSDRNDAFYRRMLRDAAELQAVGASSPLNVNGDDTVSADDAHIMYFAYGFEELVGSGDTETDGSAQWRNLFLGARVATGVHPIDPNLRLLLRNANRLATAHTSEN